MEINIEHLNENKQTIQGLLYSNIVSHHHLHLTETQRQVGGRIVEKRTGFRYGLIGSCWYGETIGGLTEVKHPL